MRQSYIAAFGAIRFARPFRRSTRTSPSPRAWWTTSIRLGTTRFSAKRNANQRNGERRPWQRVADVVGRGAAKASCPQGSVVISPPSGRPKRPAVGAPSRFGARAGAVVHLQAGQPVGRVGVRASGVGAGEVGRHGAGRAGAVGGVPRFAPSPSPAQEPNGEPIL